jgi:hypothetical protein
MAGATQNRYLVKSLVHATRVLEAFQSPGDILRLRDVVTRTGFHKGMCFRLLYSLHECGFLDKVGEIITVWRRTFDAGVSIDWDTPRRVSRAPSTRRCVRAWSGGRA